MDLNYEEFIRMITFILASRNSFFEFNEFIGLESNSPIGTLAPFSTLTIFQRFLNASR